jgi:hypothetical protein
VDIKDIAKQGVVQRHDSATVRKPSISMFFGEALSGAGTSSFVVVEIIVTCTHY